MLLMVSHCLDLKMCVAILEYNDTKKAIGNNVDKDKKESAYFLEYKARVDLKSPWTIMR